MDNRDKLTHLMKKAAPFIANVSGDVNEETVDQDIQAVLMALETHKQGADHEQYDHAWEGNNSFLSSLLVNTILPLMPETYDIGSSTYRFRKGFFSELSSLVFKKENVVVMDGQFLVTKMAGSLPEGVEAADLSIDFGREMFAGDFVLFRSEGQMEYMQIGSKIINTIYQVARNLDGSGANDWPQGTPFAVLGSAGEGWLELSAIDERRMSVWTQGSAYNNSLEIGRYGDITGWQNAGFTGMGIALGDFANHKYFVSTDVDGMMAVGLSLKIGSGEKDVDLTGIQIDDTEIVGQADGVDQVVIRTDGKLSAGKGDVVLDENGISLFNNNIMSGAGKIEFFDRDGYKIGELLGWGETDAPLTMHAINLVALDEKPANSLDLTTILSLFAESLTKSVVRIQAAQPTIYNTNSVPTIKLTNYPADSQQDIQLTGGDVIIGNSATTFGLTVHGNIEDGDGNLYGRPVFLTTPKTSTSWDGDARSTTAKTLIDLSAVFGVPAGVKAILVRMAARDSGSYARTDLYFLLSPTDAAGGAAILRPAGIVNDVYTDGMFIVPCNSNGDVYYQIVASGTGTLDAILQVWGYWL